MFEQLTKKIGELLVVAIKTELALQGHRLTGKLINSIEEVSRNTTTGFIISIVGEDYLEFVNNGVIASRIPFSGRSGRGGTSKYIQGLARFAQIKFGKSPREALSVAFAIANKHKKEGMPTKRSRRFSKTGQRTGAVQIAVEKVEDQITDLAETLLQEVVLKQFEIKI
jgi:hypothetical protein